MTEPSNPIILIPARLASTRLPGKPLADINGKPMIVHVMERAVATGIGPVFVACAEPEIAAAIEHAGGHAILTDPDHASGTDRIMEALQHIDPEKKHDIVVNVQGDLPTLDPAVIREVLVPLQDRNVDISTLAAEITDPEEHTNPHVVKAVISWQKDGRHGRALYFTRATAPANAGPRYHHIGLYAYRREALERFTSLPPSPLEQREKLEQLRALENGLRIDVMCVDTIPFGVDTPDDLARATIMMEQSL